MIGKVRVLLVDDSEDFRRSAGRFLSRQPFCELLGTALSGEEALEHVARLRPDLVLLDIAMPGVNGLEVVRRLKNDGSTARVVLVTIHDDSSYRIAAREVGADGFIPKSDFTVQVLTLLHEMAEASPPADPELP